MATTKPSMEPAKKRAAAGSHGLKRHAPGPAQEPLRQEVEVDEARERLGEGPEAMSLETPDGVDELGEELGETYVENVTGADDAATEHRAEDTPEDAGGPFVVTSGETEFALGTDASNPPDGEREALPTVSAPRRR